MAEQRRGERGRSGTDAAAERAGRQAVEAKRLAARLTRIGLEARRIAASVVQGAHGRRRPGVGESFWQFRPFMPGEAALLVDWRRSAREERLFVREREWEGAQTFWLWADRSPSMEFKSHLAPVAKADRALVLMFAVAEILVRNGERVGLIGATRPSASRAIIERLAEAVIATGSGAHGDIPANVMLNRRSEAVLIGDFLAPSDEIAAAIEPMAQLGARGHLIMLADPAEEVFPYAGQAMLAEDERGLRLRVGDAAAFGARYRERLAQHRAAIAEMCRRLNWTFALHRTDRAATEALVSLAGRIAMASHEGAFAPSAQYGAA
ncbi:Protein of unknown function DUF58 [Rhizobiales bacterium GAS113]|nr:Protein of unknown function DUF58 [Rhizobiales bacterium GAS113]